MKITIDPPIDDRRAVHFDDSPNPDFYIKEDELQELLKESGHYRELWNLQQFGFIKQEVAE